MRIYHAQLFHRRIWYQQAPRRFIDLVSIFIYQYIRNTFYLSFTVCGHWSTVTI